VLNDASLSAPRLLQALVGTSPSTVRRCCDDISVIVVFLRHCGSHSHCVPCHCGSHRHAGYLTQRMARTLWPAAP
jgi:hypothetical protein